MGILFDGLLSRLRYRIRLLPLFAVLVLSAQQDRDEPRTLSFRLDVDSLSPAAITIPEGRYAIRVVNSAVMQDISIRLDDERNARLANANSRKGGSKSTLVVRLSSGKHTLSVPGRPTWKSEITVVSKGGAAQ